MAHREGGAVRYVVIAVALLALTGCKIEYNKNMPRSGIAHVVE
jgi:hypothetical protein